MAQPTPAEGSVARPFARPPPVLATVDLYSPFMVHEKIAFRAPYLTIAVVTTIAIIASRYVGFIVIPTAACVAVGLSMFRRWQSTLPEVLDWLAAEHVSRESEPEFRSLTSLRRSRAVALRCLFGIPAVCFVSAFTFYWFDDPWTRAVYICALATWAWMLAIATTIGFQFAQFVQTIARRNLLSVACEHPDKCGGLSGLGEKIARLAAPLSVSSLILAATAVNPPIPLSVLESASVMFGEASEWTQPMVAHRKAAQIYVRVTADRISRRVPDCTKLVVPGPPTDALFFCASEVARYEAAERRMRAKATLPLLNDRLEPYARLGLVLVLAMLVILVSPIIGLHHMMARARDKLARHDQAQLRLLETRLRSETETDYSKEVEARWKTLAELRPLIMNRYIPVWPISAPTFLRMLAPTVGALVTTILKDLWS